LVFTSTHRGVVVQRQKRPKERGRGGSRGAGVVAHPRPTGLGFIYSNKVIIASRLVGRVAAAAKDPEHCDPQHEENTGGEGGVIQEGYRKKETEGGKPNAGRQLRWPFRFIAQSGAWQ
jgi:hypothetical protein